MKQSKDKTGFEDKRSVPATGSQGTSKQETRDITKIEGHMVAGETEDVIPDAKQNHRACKSLSLSPSKRRSRKTAM